MLSIDFSKTSLITVIVVAEPFKEIEFFDCTIVCIQLYEATLEIYGEFIVFIYY